MTGPAKPSTSAERKRFPTHPLNYAGVRSGLASEAVIWRVAVLDLRKRAGEAYAAGRDRDAALLRDLAKEWEPREAEARARQAQYEAEYEPSEEANG